MPANDQMMRYVRQVVAEIASISPDEVSATDRLREDLGLDSVQNMELLSRVTEEFEIDPDLELVMRLETVGEVVSELSRSAGSAALPS